MPVLLEELVVVAVEHVIDVIAVGIKQLVPVTAFIVPGTHSQNPVSLQNLKSPHTGHVILHPNDGFLYCSIQATHDPNSSQIP